MNFKRYHVSKNLFDYKTAYAQYLSGDDVVITPVQMTAAKQYFTSAEVGKALTISVYAKKVTSTRVYIIANINGVNANSNSISEGNSGLMTLNVTPTSTSDYFNLTYGDRGGYNTFNQFMLNTGSQPLPYEPYSSEVWHDIPYYQHKTATDTITTPADIYANGTTVTVGLKGNMEQSGTPSPSSPVTPQECGDLETTGEHTGQYKIPISSANTTTPVYLGEVETTRRVKKLVFDGTENWRESSDGNLFITLSPNQGVAWVRVLSTHFTSSQVQTNDGLLWFVNANVDFDTVEECKSYLAAQYANGTPVTVWYVLATPTTGIVNEPIRKIGDYADTVSGITIPTIAGANSFDVLTTLKPSEVTVNYKGWHPVTDVHEKSRNLFDKSKRTDNSRVVYTTGEIGALNGVFVSDFTPIEPNTTYTLNIVSSIFGKTGHLFALYDENKNFVNTGAHEASSATVYIFTTPSNVAYIRFNGNMASADEIMFNTGSSTLPYEPYWK